MISSVEEYNENKGLIKLTDYWTDGSIRFVNEYDGNWRQISRIEYRTDGSIWSVNEYDENGKLLRETSYYDDDRIMNIQEYDVNQNCIKYMVYEYYSDGRIWIKTEIFDEEEKIISKATSNTDGLLISFDEYDQKENLISTTYYNDDLTVQQYHVFEFDENGKHIKGTVYDNIGGNIIGDYTFYYDENGHETGYGYSY